MKTKLKGVITKTTKSFVYIKTNDDDDYRFNKEKFEKVDDETFLVDSDYFDKILSNKNKKDHRRRRHTYYRI